MNVLISDYDNTLHVCYKNKIMNMIIFHYNLLMINKFQKNKNNKFVIATGRYFNSIYNDINKYHIKFDYLICNNGAEVYDCNYNSLYETPLDPDDVNYLKENFKSMRICYNYQKNNIIAMIYYSKSEEDKQQIYKILKENIKNSYIELKEKKIKILPLGIDKSYPIKKLFNSNENIYAIGDDENDIKLLTTYKGYTVKRKQNIFNNDKNVIIVNSVGHLIKQIGGFKWNK